MQRREDGPISATVFSQYHQRRILGTVITYTLPARRRRRRRRHLRIDDRHCCFLRTEWLTRRDFLLLCLIFDLENRWFFSFFFHSSSSHAPSGALNRNPNTNGLDHHYTKENNQRRKRQYRTRFFLFSPSFFFGSLKEKKMMYRTINHLVSVMRVNRKIISIS